MRRQSSTLGTPAAFNFMNVERSDSRARRLAPATARPEACRARRGRGGFNIIEVMMATTILFVGFIGVIQAITIGTEIVDASRKQQVAHQLIAAEIEKLRGGAWATIAGLPATAALTINLAGAITGDTTAFALANRTSDPADDNTALRDQARGFTCSFVRTWLRPTTATASTVTFVQVVYTVTWTGNTGRAHRHTVETFLAMNGLHLSYQQS